MKNQKFDSKWDEASKSKANEEFSIFVPKGETPETQRQFNLFNYFEFIGKIAEENNVKDTLEIGCGRGTISMYCEQYLGHKITATDLSDNSIKLAKKNFKRHGIKGAIEKADATKLQFKKNSFDMTTSIGLVEHFEDYQAVFDEQFRVLRKNGVMISLNIPKKKSIQTLNDTYRYFLKQTGQKLKKDYFRNTDKPKDFINAAKKSGFKKVETFYVNSFPLFTPLSPKTEKTITNLYRFIYSVRGLCMNYPFKGSSILSQAHFLIAYK